MIALSTSFLVRTEGLGWNGASHPKANVEASGEAEGLGQTEGLNIQEKKSSFSPGFNKLSPPGLGCQKLPRRCQCTVAEPRGRGWAARGVPRAVWPARGKSAGRGQGSSVPGLLPPCVLALFPQQTCPLSVVRLNILAWREGRRKPRGPSKPIRLDWGRGGREPQCAPRETRQPAGPVCSWECKAPLEIQKDSPACPGTPDTLRGTASSPSFSRPWGWLAS